MRAKRKSAVALALLALTTACTTTTDGAGTPPSSAGPSSSPQSPTVGAMHHSWSEADTDTVRDYDDATEDVVLVRTPQELQAWAAGLPSEMREGFTAPNLSGAVAVVGNYPKCMESSAVRSPAAAQVRFDVWIAPEDQGTACAWSPLQVEVYVVQLDEIDADSPEGVELVA